MGHRAGEDVFGRIYTLDHPEVTPFLEVAAMLERNIVGSVGTLMTTTTRPVHWGITNPLLARADHVDATLGAAGWQVDPGSTDNPLCSIKRVAAELGMQKTSVLRWMEDGTLPVVVAPDSNGVSRKWALLSEVWAVRDRRAERVLLPDLAEQLGLRYHELYNMVRRLDLHLDLYPGTREYQVTTDAVTVLQAEHDRVKALHRRSIKLAAAARQLRVALSTAALLASRGELNFDPETDSSGARFVGRSSVDRCWIARSSVGRRSGRAPAGVPLAEVVRFTGYSARELMDLVRAGVLEQLPGRSACQLTPPSLRSWMVGWEVDVGRRSRRFDTDQKSNILR
jgi:hypothetical protein